VWRQLKDLHDRPHALLETKAEDEPSALGDVWKLIFG